MSFGDRSQALIDLLEALNANELEYVLVGGYAVSAFNTRFSTDLDIVATSDDEDEFVAFLEAHGFERIASHEKAWSQTNGVVEFEKRLAPRQPIGFDLLVDGLGCRQTQAQWSFDYLQRHSDERVVSGATARTTAPVVDGALLVAARLHSARETDLRDVLAVAEAIDLEAVTPHLVRGDDQALRAQLERGLEILESEALEHGFRSDFGASTVSEATIRALRDYLTDRVAALR